MGAGFPIDDEDFFEFTMATRDSATVTAILKRIGTDDPSAFDSLLPLVLDELKGLARGFLRGERPDHTLQPTALVHEAYLRLVDQTVSDLQDRRRFLAVASRAMRHILVDHARGKRAQKRGGDARQITLDEKLAPPQRRNVALEELEEALARLESLDERKARVIELRFFGGLTIRETAEVLGISPKTVEADWYFSRAWLARELGDEPA